MVFLVPQRGLHGDALVHGNYNKRDLFN